MPEPFVPKDDTSKGKQDNEPITDVFGSDNKDPIPPKEGGDDGDKGKDDKKFETIPDDHPTIVALKEQIENVKKEYGGNLAGQRDVIKKLEGQIDALTKKGGKDGEQDTSHLPFDPKTIVFSKDLPKERLDDMTDNEIKLHDELMQNRQIMNKQAQESFDFKQKSENDKKSAEDKQVDDLNTLIRDTAKSLAGDNQDVANQIIESVKQFNLTGLKEDEVKTRVENAYKLLPDYKPPKEPVTRKGNPVKTGTDDKTDPFGTNKIVDEVASQRNGKSFSL